MIHMFAWVGGFLVTFVLGEEALVSSEVEDHNMNRDVSKKSHRSESWRFELTRKEPSIAGKKTVQTVKNVHCRSHC